MIAFSASVVNLSMGLVGNMVGVFVNHTFVGVEEDDLSNYYILSYIGLAGCAYQFFLVRLIPVQEEIDAAVRLRKEQRDEIARQSTNRSNSTMRST